MKYIGQEQTIRVGGTVYRLSRLTRRIWREWHAWAVSRLPDPLALAAERIDSFPCPEALVDAAEALARDIEAGADPLTEAFLSSEESLRHLAGLLLALHHPDIDPAPVVATIPLAELLDIITTATGQYHASEHEIEEAYLREVGILPAPTTAPRRPVDWAGFDRHLFQQFYLTPHDLDEMTLPEIMAICRADDDAPDASAAVWADALAHVEACRKLTPRQQLELAARKHR